MLVDCQDISVRQPVFRGKHIFSGFVLTPTLVRQQNQTCTCHSEVQITELGGANLR